MSPAIIYPYTYRWGYENVLPIRSHCSHCDSIYKLLILHWFFHLFPSSRVVFNGFSYSLIRRWSCIFSLCFTLKMVSWKQPVHIIIRDNYCTRALDTCQFFRSLDSRHFIFNEQALYMMLVINVVTWCECLRRIWVVTGYDGVLSGYDDSICFNIKSATIYQLCIVTGLTA